MWYLIIPPIIVVVSLSFALWYLSRKGADPLVAEKASWLEEEAKHQASFPRIKTFFLHILEKMAQRFKVMSLKMHNASHNLTHSIKEKKRRFQEKTSTTEPAEKPEEQLKLTVANTSFWKRYKKDEEAIDEKEVVTTASVKEIVLEKPIVRKRKKILSTEEEIVSRPMVSEAVTHPEKEYVKMRKNDFREADLIARISANPKDFAAYEELGDYYLEIGNVQDAKECYRQVLKLSPAERMVRIKVRRLEKILSQKAE